MQHRFTPITLFIWSGLLIWVADFLFIYVFAAIACARGFAQLGLAGVPIVPLATTLASVLAFFATAAVMRVALRRLRSHGPTEAPAAFIDFLAFALAALALVAIVWSALPPLLLRIRC